MPKKEAPETVMLYAVAWEDGRPRVVSVEADNRPASFRPKWRLGVFDEFSRQRAFHHREVVGHPERQRLHIGLAPVDAVHLVFEDRKMKEANLEARLLEVRRELTELSVLGMAEAKVVP